MPPGQIQDLEQRLSQEGIPPTVITRAEREQIDAALLASRALVDAMDETILQKVYGELDTCIAAAAAANRSIAPIVQLYIAMWVNMTGPPDKILDFLRGPDPGATVQEADIKTYLLATKYFRENPRNFPHMVESAQKGAEELPQA